MQFRSIEFRLQTVCILRRTAFAVALMCGVLSAGIATPSFAGPRKTPNKITKLDSAPKAAATLAPIKNPNLSARSIMQGTESESVIAAQLSAVNSTEDGLANTDLPLAPPKYLEHVQAEDAKGRSAAILANFHQHQDGKASEQIESLMEYGGRVGALGFPKLAAEILHIAAATTDNARASFLVRSALKVAPYSARTALRAAHLAFEKALPEGYAALNQAFFSLTSAPAILISIASDVILLALLSMTLALFLLCAAQFASAGSSMLESISHHFPISVRGILPPAMLCLLLILPLPFGVLTILFCWAIVIAWNLPRCQWLAAGVGSLMVCWAAMMPIEEALIPRINSEVQTALEEVNAGSVIPGVIGEFEKGLKVNGREPAIVVAAAQAALREGKLDEAEKYLQSVVGRDSLRGPLLRTIYVLLGTVSYHKNDLVLAREFLTRAEELGEKSFELYFYMAQISIASTDVPGHSKYNLLANQVDAERLRQLLMADTKISPLSVISLPIFDQARLLLRPMHPNEVSKSDLTGAIQALSSILFPIPGDAGRIFFSIFALNVGIFIRFRKVFQHALTTRLSTSTEREQSPVWQALPAGSLIVGQHPVGGACVLAFTLMLIFVATDSPIRTTALHEFSKPFSVAYLCAAVLMLLMPMIWSFRKRPARRRS